MNNLKKTIFDGCDKSKSGLFAVELTIGDEVGYFTQYNNHKQDGVLRAEIGGLYEAMMWEDLDEADGAVVSFMKAENVVQADVIRLSTETQSISKTVKS